MRPELVDAHLAIRPEGESVAASGRVSIAADRGFTLHAVLEGRAGDGSPIYYSEAPALELAGERIPDDRVRPWDAEKSGWSGAVVRILWFSVEGFVPYLALREAEDLERFRFEEFLRADWPRTWSVPGTVEPMFDEHLVRPNAVESGDHGTQRFHVRIEIYDSEEGLVPKRRFSSPGATEVVDSASSFPTVVATLPGALEDPSRVFGLTQIEPIGVDMPSRLRELHERGLAFSHRLLVDGLLEGRTIEELEWRLLDPEGSLEWGPDGVQPGDLARFDGRIVVLARDADRDGLVDGEDLCFDYERGALTLPLEAASGGESGSWVDRTP